MSKGPKAIVRVVFIYLKLDEILQLIIIKNFYLIWIVNCKTIEIKSVSPSIGKIYFYKLKCNCSLEIDKLQPHRVF